MQALELDALVARPAATVRRRAWTLPAGVAAIAFALALVVYNNVAYTFYDVAFPPAWLLFPKAVALPAIAIGWAAWACRLSLVELGLSRDRLVRGAGAGLGLAALAAAPVAGLLGVAAILDIDAFSFRNIERASDRPGYALYWVLLLYPVHTVVFEEVLFRGLLQGLGTRAFGVARGVALTAGAFALWHVAVDYRVLSRAEIADYPALFIPLQIIVLLAIFAGGVLLGMLRERTGSVLAPIAFHWGFLVLLAGTLFVLAL